MFWARASFKGAKVWAEVDAEGAPIVNDGRISVRYSDKAGATIYKAGASRVEPAGGKAMELPEGSAAAEGPAAAGNSAVGGGSAGNGGGGARPALGTPRNAPGSGPGDKRGAAIERRGSGFGSAGTRTAAQATAAKAAAGAQLAASAHAIQCFTDGACVGNPGPAGSGLVVKFPDGTRIERHRALGLATNNIGELTAIEMALDELAAASVDPAAAVVVFSDSQYARGVLTLGWKAKANVSLIAGIRAKLRDRPGVSLQWVAGHVGIAENERADALAGRGVEDSRRGGGR
ncbi:hypothetical protein LBMAG42_48760 [Deltaproteobacteria bacterium]|nr:hypothetical protein LBMAG42_48760 [Deltaproteobacteria bacterium]